MEVTVTYRPFKLTERDAVVQTVIYARGFTRARKYEKYCENHLPVIFVATILKRHKEAYRSLLPVCGHDNHRGARDGSWR